MMRTRQGQVPAGPEPDLGSPCSERPGPLKQPAAARNSPAVATAPPPPTVSQARPPSRRRRVLRPGQPRPASSPLGCPIGRGRRHGRGRGQMGVRARGGAGAGGGAGLGRRSDLTAARRKYPSSRRRGLSALDSSAGATMRVTGKTFRRRRADSESEEDEHGCYCS